MAEASCDVDSYHFSWGGDARTTIHVGVNSPCAKEIRIEGIHTVEGFSIVKQASNGFAGCLPSASRIR
jgi:hypothetical protein